MFHSSSSTDGTSKGWDMSDGGDSRSAPGAHKKTNNKRAWIIIIIIIYFLNTPPSQIWCLEGHATTGAAGVPIFELLKREAHGLDYETLSGSRREQH